MTKEMDNYKRKVNHLQNQMNTIQEQSKSRLTNMKILQHQVQQQSKSLLDMHKNYKEQKVIMRTLRMNNNHLLTKNTELKERLREYNQMTK